MGPYAHTHVPGCLISVLTTRCISMTVGGEILIIQVKFNNFIDELSDTSQHTDFPAFVT